MQHHTVPLFGSQVHYWVANDTQTSTIIVIHGFRGTHRGLIDVMAGLPDYRLITLDLPGFGQSTPMTDRPHTITGYADLVIGLIDSLKLKRVAILGHSMGTVIAAGIAARRPALVSHLVLINPIAESPLRGLGLITMAPGVWYHWVAGRLLPEKIGHRILTNRWLFLLGSVTMTKTRNKALRRQIHHHHVTYMGQFANRRTLLEAYHSSLRDFVADYASRIHTPTLLIAGAIDAIAPIKGQRKLATALAHGTLVELPGVGHIIHYEKPAEAAAAINEFLRSSAPAA